MNHAVRTLGSSRTSGIVLSLLPCLLPPSPAPRAVFHSSQQGRDLLVPGTELPTVGPPKLPVSLRGMGGLARAVGAPINAVAFVFSGAPQSGRCRQIPGVTGSLPRRANTSLQKANIAVQTTGEKEHAVRNHECGDAPALPSPSRSRLGRQWVQCATPRLRPGTSLRWPLRRSSRSSRCGPGPGSRSRPVSGPRRTRGTRRPRAPRR